LPGIKITIAGIDEDMKRSGLSSRIESLNILLLSLTGADHHTAGNEENGNNVCLHTLITLKNEYST
jgi:hypothetical protein